MDKYTEEQRKRFIGINQLMIQNTAQKAQENLQGAATTTGNDMLYFSSSKHIYLNKKKRLLEALFNQQENKTCRPLFESDSIPETKKFKRTLAMTTMEKETFKAINNEVACNEGRDYRSKRMTTDAAELLKATFLENKYPTKEDYTVLCAKTAIPLKNLRIWFQNQRAKKKEAAVDSVAQEVAQEMRAQMVVNAMKDDNIEFRSLEKSD